MKFKEFLVEYQFKSPLPPGVKKIYADHFSEKEKNALKQFDTGWSHGDHISGCCELRSRFRTDRRYPIGTPTKSAEVVIRKFRDRYRIEIEFYDQDPHISDVSRRPAKKQRFEFPMRSLNDFKQKTFNYLQKTLTK